MPPWNPLGTTRSTAFAQTASTPLCWLVVSDTAERILVTGANGHLARRFICYCAERSGAFEIRAVVRSERAAGVLRALPEARRPEVVVVDYADPHQLTAAMQGCSTAIHLAGILKETRANRYADAHERPAEALVRAADVAGIARMVHTSILGADSSSPNPCLASRGRTDEILLAARAKTLVMRIPMVLGPGDAASAALRRQAEAGTARLVRGGATLEQPIAARDVVAALFAAAAGAGASAATLELAGPESLSHRELVRRAAAVLGTTVSVASLPGFVAFGAARIANALLPEPPITPAMLGVLEHDDAVDPEPARKALGIELTPLDEALRLAFLNDVEEA
jgi:NADH dehydrogenase